MLGCRGLAEVADAWIFVQDLFTAGQVSKLHKLQNLGHYQATELLWRFSKTAQCQDALKSLVKTSQVHCEDASSHLFRASLFDIIGDHESARDVLETSPFKNEGDFAYSSERYRREIDCKRKLTEFDQRETKKRKSEPIPRIDLRDFNQDIYDHHVKSKTPLIIFNANLSSQSISDDWMIGSLGHLCPVMYRPMEGSINWASLELMENLLLSEYLQSWRRNDWDLQVYEISLQEELPYLLELFNIPDSFKIENNWLDQTQNATEFTNAFPGLSIQNVKSRFGLHADQFFMPYWNGLLRGGKHWKIYHPDDFWMLGPTWVGGNLHPHFDASVPNLAEYARCWEGDQMSDEVIWGPGGSPHEVFNLAETVSLNGNLMDEFHFDNFIKDVSITALVNDTAAKLQVEMLNILPQLRS